MPRPVAREFCPHATLDPIDYQNFGAVESFRWAYSTGDCYRCLTSVKNARKRPAQRRIPITTDQATVILAWLALRQIGCGHILQWLNPDQRHEAIRNAYFVNILRKTPTMIAQPEWLDHPVWSVDPLIQEDRDLTPAANTHPIYHYSRH